MFTTRRYTNPRVPLPLSYLRTENKTYLYTLRKNTLTVHAVTYKIEAVQSRTLMASAGVGPWQRPASKYSWRYCSLSHCTRRSWSQRLPRRCDAATSRDSPRFHSRATWLGATNSTTRLSDRPTPNSRVRQLLGRVDVAPALAATAAAATAAAAPPLPPVDPLLAPPPDTCRRASDTTSTAAPAPTENSLTTARSTNPSSKSSTRYGSCS